jgi:hypothetical protein
LRTLFVEELAEVWFQLTSCAPTRAVDPVTGRQMSPFQRFCEAACKSMSPEIDCGPIDDAVRKAVNKWRENRSAGMITGHTYGAVKIITINPSLLPHRRSSS